MTIQIILYRITIFLGLLQSLPTFALQEHTTLKQLDKKISSAQAALSAAQSARASEVHSLKTTELVVSQHTLSNLMRAMYAFGPYPTLKLVLNQSDANQVSRQLMYYHYMSQHQAKLMADLQQTADKIRHKQQTLNDLLDHKKLLEQTIVRLDKESQLQTVMHENFSNLKGSLYFPTQGKVAALFGTKIYQSELRWDGILITAALDQPIYAIADGQVVFAKWLPSYGLLLIISHGHGYMTLYGRNHYLYKKPGDVVRMGELIATVGNSGGYDSPALYFAIRHNAVPENPLVWCHGHT